MTHPKISIPGDHPWTEWVLVPPQEAEAQVLAIDPWDCRCTECIAGVYVPLDQASPVQLEQMRQGRIRNNTSWVWEHRVLGEE